MAICSLCPTEKTDNGRGGDLDQCRCCCNEVRALVPNNPESQRIIRPLSTAKAPATQETKLKSRPLKVPCEEAFNSVEKYARSRHEAKAEVDLPSAYNDRLRNSLNDVVSRDSPRWLDFVVRLIVGFALISVILHFAWVYLSMSRPSEED